jgi:hypothetical protein
MIVIVEWSVEWELAGETEALGENLHQRHLVHHKTHMIWPGIEPGPPRWEAGLFEIRQQIVCLSSYHSTSYIAATDTFI